MQSTGSVVKCFWSGGGACVCRAAKEDVVVDEMHVGGLMCLLSSAAIHKVSKWSVSHLKIGIFQQFHGEMVRVCHEERDRNARRARV